MVYFVMAVGCLFSIFWIAQLVFVKLHANWTNRIIDSDERDKEIAVSIIHPIKDLDFQFEENLESILNQNYRGCIQHIFSFQDPGDPAVNVVKKMQIKYPHIDMEVIVNPVLSGLNGKSSNMVNGVKRSKYDMVLFVDSDIRVKSDFVVKMIRPLKDEKVGITTCGQINIGGRDFWTRFFTFLQNGETDFIWAFFTKLGLDLGATGAAFAMRKKLLQDIGGLEAFGSSLLEDLHLGNTLYKMGYKLILGPFLECHVDKLEKEKSFNYAKRIAIGVKTHIAVDLPAFLTMLFWYWALLIISLIIGSADLFHVSLLFVCIRILHGLAMRLVTWNKIMPVDFVMGLFFDLFGTFYLLYSFNKPFVTWRGVKYEVKSGGFIEDSVEVTFGEEALEEQVKDRQTVS